jgi:hypothetical protein
MVLPSADRLPIYVCRYFTAKKYSWFMIKWASLAMEADGNTEIFRSF